MACVICEHCQAPVAQHEDMAVLNGFSYHEKCHKCYVCSETNLHNAEVFKGVIFCSSCSQRIFQGCSTARRTKDSSRKTKDRSHRRRSHRTQERKEARPHNILAMAGLTACNDSSKSFDSKDDSKAKLSKSLTKSTVVNLKSEAPSYKKSKSIKKSSVEMGMTTEMTQQLLKQMTLPLISDHKKPTKIVHERTERSRKKSSCTDLRMAELGTSREIANMALRHKSEMPVIIKSETQSKHLTSLSGSPLNRESVESGDQNVEWLDSAYSTLKGSTMISQLMDRNVQSILKIPFKSFKRNILNRSSLVSVLLNSEDNVTLLKKIKEIFKHEITEHQKRGLMRLYSTINRQQVPNKLGWLNMVTNVYGNDNMLRLSRGSYQKRCKHFKTSHSYRCMRAQVMKLAGPTKSQLAMFRAKMLNMLAPGFLRNVPIGYRKFPQIMMTQACGNSNPASLKA